LLDLVEDEGFAHAWDEYCRYYLAAPEEQTARFGAPLRGISLIPAYSRLLAQHAASADDAAQAERAWEAFLLGKGDQVNSDAMVARADWSLTRIDGPTVHEPVDEAAFLGTNGCAQYGLSAIANLALIGDHLPQQIPYLGPAPDLDHLLATTPARSPTAAASCCTCGPRGSPTTSRRTRASGRRCVRRSPRPAGATTPSSCGPRTAWSWATSRRTT